MRLAGVLWQHWELCVGVGPALMVLAGTGGPEGVARCPLGTGDAWRSPGGDVGAGAVQPPLPGLVSRW